MVFLPRGSCLRNEEVPFFVEDVQLVPMRRFEGGAFPVVVRRASWEVLGSVGAGGDAAWGWMRLDRRGVAGRAGGDGLGRGRGSGRGGGVAWGVPDGLRRAGWSGAGVVVSGVAVDVPSFWKRGRMWGEVQRGCRGINLHSGDSGVL